MTKTWGLVGMKVMKLCGICNISCASGHNTTQLNCALKVKVRRWTITTSEHKTCVQSHVDTKSMDSSNKRERKPNGQSRMENPETLTISGMGNQEWRIQRH